PATIFNIRLTCRCLATVIQRYMQVACNIDRSLMAFFDDVHGFRRLQYETGMLISGSFALQFMGRLKYDGTDLDLYLPMHGRMNVAIWLSAHGYNFCPTVHQPQDFLTALNTEDLMGDDDVDYPSTGIYTILTFKRNDSKDILTRKVQIIVAWRTPMEVILGFHSTCVMNFITHTTAYSLYPRATFEDTKSLVLLDTPLQSHALQKYQERGWTLVRQLHFPDFDLDLSFRSLVDNRTWI
ncbi:hypothetical protein BDW22DRAFT_1296455, partial [Trametopsis cervina]